MAKEHNQQEKIKQNWFEKIIRTPLFGLICLILTLLVNAIVASTSKDWKWAVITAIVLSVLLILMFFLSFLMRKEREDIMKSIIQEDGLLHGFLQQRIGEFNENGKHLSDVHSCLSDVQKECERRILLKQEYEKIKFFNLKEELEFEGNVKNGEIWVVTDDISTDVNNKPVYETIASNIKNGTIYHYFYNKKEGVNDNIEIIKEALQREYSIENIDSKIIFEQVGNDYSALLTILKGVIILHPNNRDKRQSFLCIYASVDANIVFYRELNPKETNVMCDMIRKLLPPKETN